jgi:demethylmenaquinone methyltransferase / 2-methoxy-6-polyprenyl-1,4-benzoquinol methylase
MREGLSVDAVHGIYERIAKFYDVEHAILTARSDQRGRRLLVRDAVSEGDRVVDCGAGTGSTAILAAEKVGSSGHVTLFDLSEEMLGVAKERATRLGLVERMSFDHGDMLHLPYDDGAFDVALSTYSLCPVYDPAKAAKEIYRVVRPGGRIGIAHSVDPRNPLVRRLGAWIEAVAWHLQWLSMGCRSVSVLPALEACGGHLLSEKRIGVPLWPFTVFVVEKPLKIAAAA